MIADAKRGDSTAVGRLLGQASAWLSDGRYPPAPLDKWTAGVIGKLSKEILRKKPKESTKQRDARIAMAIGIHRSIRGRQPGLTRLQQNRLYQDVLHFMRTERLLPGKAIKRTVAYHKQMSAERSPNDPRKTVSEAHVKAAYYAGRKTQLQKGA